MSPKAGPTRRFQLRVPAEERHLAEIRDFIQEVGEKIQVPGRTVGNTKLAVDEACTNVVKHSYKGTSGFIEVIVTGNLREYSIEIRDQGESFDLRNVKTPDLKMYVENRKKGGLGVYLMNALMDDVRYRHGTDGNVLTMTKRLGKHRRRRGKGVTPRSPRFAYTLQALREETISHARSVARGLALPAADLLSRPEPMSIEQTLLNQSIRAALKANPEYVAAQVLDTSGRVWGSNRFEELFTTVRVGRHPGSGAGLGSQWAPPEYRVSSGVGTVVEPVRAGTSGKALGTVIGYVTIGVNDHALEGRIGAARAELAGIALLTLFLGCGLSVILIGIFVRPIQVLSDSVRAIGEGTMMAEVGGSGNEEIDEIARAFN